MVDLLISTACDRLGSKRKSGLLHSKPLIYPIPLHPPHAPPTQPAQSSRLSKAARRSGVSTASNPMDEEAHLARYLPRPCTQDIRNQHTRPHAATTTSSNWCDDVTSDVTSPEDEGCLTSALDSRTHRKKHRHMSVHESFVSRTLPKRRINTKRITTSKGKKEW